MIQQYADSAAGPWREVLQRPDEVIRAVQRLNGDRLATEVLSPDLLGGFCVMKPLDPDSAGLRDLGARGLRCDRSRCGTRLLCRAPRRGDQIDRNTINEERPRTQYKYSAPPMPVLQLNGPALDRLFGSNNRPTEARIGTFNNEPEFRELVNGGLKMDYETLRAYIVAFFA